MLQEPPSTEFPPHHSDATNIVAARVAEDVAQTKLLKVRNGRIKEPVTHTAVVMIATPTPSKSASRIIARKSESSSSGLEKAEKICREDSMTRQPSTAPIASPARKANQKECGTTSRARFASLSSPFIGDDYASDWRGRQKSFRLSESCLFGRSRSVAEELRAVAQRRNAARGALELAGQESSPVWSTLGASVD